MNERRKLVCAACAVVLLTLALAPAARRMGGHDGADAAKRAAIAQALDGYGAYLRGAPAVEVEPLADMETVWAIEDAREEAPAPLVTAMYNGGDELGRDAQSGTFYCTLGMDGGEAWPELALRARGEAELRVVWVDDYSYDFCGDAIAEGYAYELLAYTPTQYAYIRVVFTGLPIVTLHAQHAITADDTPARATVAAAGYAPVSEAALVHLRGGGYQKVIDKPSYRIELHALDAGQTDTRYETGVLGMEPDSDWLLLANAQDDTAVRNKLAWDIWNDWHPEGEGLLQLRSEMVELFVDDTYMGLYQLMQRVQEEEEIVRAGGNPATDGVVRIVAKCNPSQKPLRDMQTDGLNSILEYRYEPHGDAQRLFEAAADYGKLSRKPDMQLDDEAFAALALERIDVRSMMEYTLFYHVCQLQDNSGNNIYLFLMRQEDGRVRYLHAPWDMDTGFWVKPDSETGSSMRWPDVSMILPKRMLDLDVGGCRAIIWDMWREKRVTLLTDEAMHARFDEMEAYINASGAYLRESQRWYGEAKKLNLSEMAYYETQNLDLIERTLAWFWPIEDGDAAQ